MIGIYYRFNYLKYIYYNINSIGDYKYNRYTKRKKYNGIKQNEEFTNILNN